MSAVNVTSLRGWIWSVELIELYPHQKEAIGKLHNGSVLRGGVGSGKSITSLAFYIQDCDGQFKTKETNFSPMRRPRDLYIITTAKKRDDGDWWEDAGGFGLGVSSESTNVYGTKIIVDSWNNITKYEEIKDAFFIFDEQRLVGSGSWVKAFYKIAKANRWIVLTATPGDTWMDFIPLFVANGFYKNRTEFIRRHVVFSNFSKFPKVSHYVETGRLEAIRRRLLVEMQDTRHTKRHVENILVSHDKEAFDRIVKDRWNLWTDEPIKDVSEMFRLMRRLVNSDVARLGAVMEIFERHPKLIIFYNFNYELEALRTLASTLNVEVKEWNGHKHETVPEGEKWLYLVQYTAGAEGWNCITTDTIVFYSLTYSWKAFEQAKGRIDRLNTPFTDLHYYVIQSGGR